MTAARYIGPDPCPVRIGDRCIARDEIVTGPPDVVAELQARADFETVETAPAAPAPKRAHRAPKDPE